MSTNSNKTKSDQLGIPFGTACHKLRSMIMFKLVKMTGQDKCYKCGNNIASEAELSIEHKTPWLHNGADLFWDLDNITFSHRKCNKAERFNPVNRIVSPPGMSWCNDHKGFSALQEFTKNSSKKKGIEDACKACRKARSSKYRKSKLNLI